MAKKDEVTKAEAVVHGAVVHDAELIKLVQQAHELHLHNAFSPLQQADFFAKVTALFATGASK